VRRLRIYLSEREYEFVNLDIFADKDRELLTRNNPAQKVPALIDGDQCIYDSRVIFRYLTSKYKEVPLSWSQENLLTLIDAANDSLVSMLLLQRSSIDTEQDSLFFNLQRERVEQVFTVLNDEVLKGHFGEWNYPSICLFCLLDWADFRGLAKWHHFEKLEEFYRKYKLLPVIELTNPR